MTEDLKRQASELYRERTEKEEIPTSDSLSMKKLFYIVLGLSLLAVLVIQTFGGLKQHAAPAGASDAPPPVVKQAPVSPQPATFPSQPEPATPAEQKQEISTQDAKPVKQPDASPVKKEIRRSAGLEKPLPEAGNRVKLAEAKPEAVPEVSPLEAARQELARDIVLEKSPALAKLIGDANDNLEYRGWKAEAAGADAYQVTFTFHDKSVGSPIQYVWRVDLNARSISPLSYYARKLP